jgi:hypothetical protein
MVVSAVLNGNICGIEKAHVLIDKFELSWHIAHLANSLEHWIGAAN